MHPQTPLCRCRLLKSRSEVYAVLAVSSERHEMSLQNVILALVVSGFATPSSMSRSFGEAPTAPIVFSAQAESLPFPPDAREVEFNATFGDIEFASSSSLPSLAAFYRDELAKRGWTADESASTTDEDSVEMTFTHEGAQVQVDLDARSDDVAVSIESEGLDFSQTSDPAKLVTAGVPQPRAYLFLQKELPRPGLVQGESYRSDECHFKSPLALQAAFDFYGKELKRLGWRESRRPIVTGDRRYTEFRRGSIEVGVNIFSDDVGSRIILGYENDAKEPVVPPLDGVVSVAANERASESSGENQNNGSKTSAKVAVNVSKNSGSVAVVLGAKEFIFKHAAAYRTEYDGETKTRLLFCERAIPLQRMQSLLAKEGDLSFGDLFEFDHPGHLILEVSDRVYFSFNAGGVGIGDSIDELENDLKINAGRVSGAIKMSEPKEFFDEAF